MPTEKPEIFSGFLRFSPFSSLFWNSDFSANKKMPIGVLGLRTGNEPFPCLFRGDICDFSSQISPLFSLFSKKSLLKNMSWKEKKKWHLLALLPTKKYLSYQARFSEKWESGIFYYHRKETIMNAIISNGNYTARVQLPVERRQLAGRKCVSFWYGASKEKAKRLNYS